MTLHQLRRSRPIQSSLPPNSKSSTTMIAVFQSPFLVPSFTCCTIVYVMSSVSLLMIRSLAISFRYQREQEPCVHLSYVSSRIVWPCEWFPPFAVGATGGGAIVHLRAWEEDVGGHMPSHISLLGCPMGAPCKCAEMGLDMGVEMLIERAGCFRLPHTSIPQATRCL